MKINLEVYKKHLFITFLMEKNPSVDDCNHTNPLPHISFAQHK